MRKNLFDTLTYLTYLEKVKEAVNIVGSGVLFPMICFESSVLIYIWLSRQDSDNKPQIVFGQYNENYSVDSRNQIDDDSCPHVWIKYKEKLIDYTHIQFELSNMEVDYTLDELKSKFDLQSYPYIFDKNDVRYFNSINIEICPHLQKVILILIQDASIITFKQLVDKYIKMIVEQQSILNYRYKSIKLFNIHINMYNWYKKYNLGLKNYFECEKSELLEEYYKYIQNCREFYF